MSVGSVIVSIATVITRPLVDVIWKELNYLFRPRKYVEEMSTRVQQLVPSRDRVQREVDEAEGFGQDVGPEVGPWLSSVNEIIDKGEALRTARKRYLNGWCVDLCSQYRVNKGAKRITKRIRLLQPPPVSVALPPPPPSIPSSNPNVLELESTTSTIQLIMEALGDENCDIVGVVGMGGVGKTTIVTQVAEKIKANGQFEQVVMAVVSQTPDVKSIQDHIASMLKLKLDGKASESGRASQLEERILNIQSILVIIDDLWEKLDLNVVGIPYSSQHKGLCKILLTTRDDQVCVAMGVRPDRRVPVQPLSVKESWKLFRKNAGDQIDSPSLRKIAEDVMEECGGLPIALVTVGSALREKHVKFWTAAKKELRKSKVTLLKGVSHTVVSCLRLSYNYIEGKDAKLLFLLCSLFPEDCEIEIEVLVRYAVGKESLFEDDVGTIEEARTLVHATIDNLRASHLFLESAFRKDHIKMHDIVRDVAISIASEDENHRFLIKTGQGLREWPVGKKMEQCTAVSLMDNDIESLCEGSADAAKLEMLCLRGIENFCKITDSFSERMKILSVLDVSKQRKITDSVLKGVKMLSVLDVSKKDNLFDKKKIPLQISSFQFLTRLRTLLLDGNRIDDLSGIGKLKQLEILSLRGCAFSNEALPVEIGELSRLKLLDLSHSCVDIMPANVLSRLSQLEELYMMDSFGGWEVTESKNASLSEVQSLSRLAKISVYVEGFKNFPADLQLAKTVSCFSFVVGVDPPLEYRWSSRYPKGGERHLEVNEIRNLDEVQSSFRLASSLKVDCLELECYDDVSQCLLSSNLFKREQRYVRAPDRSPKNEILTDLVDKGGSDLDGLRSLSVRRFNCNITAITTTTPATAPKAVFPNLQRLELLGVRGLTSLGIQRGGGGVLPQRSLQSLRVLEIQYCTSLRGAAVPSSWAPRLHNLEQLKIGYCYEVTEIFENVIQIQHFSKGKEELKDCFSPLVLCSLRVIELSELLQLTAIWNTPGTLPSCFPANSTNLLTRVHIFYCPKLLSIFPPGLSQSLSHLQTLQVDNCPNLEVIFEEDGPPQDDGIIINLPIRLPNLKSVTVSKCHKLKSLFTVSTAQATPRLQVLDLDNNRGLQEILSSNINRMAEYHDRKQITWPQLSTLKLVYLRNLRRICPRDYSVHVPHLKTLTYYECLAMENFASDTTAYGLNLPQLVKPQFRRSEWSKILEEVTQ